MRLVQIRNKAAASEIITDVSIRTIKLIVNQLDLLVVYIASLIPSETTIISFPLTYNTYMECLTGDSTYAVPLTLPRTLLNPDILRSEAFLEM